MLDKIIINGTVIDGTGAPAKKCAVGIKEGKIVMNPQDFCAKETIDANGKIVCPGFIDAHSHGDRLIGKEDGRLFKTPQGITTELCGNCGDSDAPLCGAFKDEIVSGITRYSVEETSKWDTFDAFLSFVDRQKLSANARFYVGHNMLRRSTMGYANRPATASELDEMKQKLRLAMEAGAAGLSTGLIYIPSCYAGDDEVLELAKVIATYDGIYASHIRNESDKVVESVQEVLDIGEKAGVRTNISHHKVQGMDNWGKQNVTLELIDKANANGYHTTLDIYPYTRSMNVMRSCLPPWHFSDGTEAFVKRLKNDNVFREQLKCEMQDPTVEYDNFYRNSGGWDGVMIAYADASVGAAGLTVSEYAKKLGKDPFDTYFDMLIENKLRVGGVYQTMREEDMIQIAKSPYCVIGTDGCSLSWKHHGHPRGSAAFPQAIDFFVKEKKVFTLEEMIYKMTGLTAERLLVPNKGLLKDGYDADILIFDYDNLKINANYTSPHEKTDGIDEVIVGGQTVYKDLEFTGVYSGKVIRKK